MNENQNPKNNSIITSLSLLLNLILIIAFIIYSICIY